MEVGSRKCWGGSKVGAWGWFQWWISQVPEGVWSNGTAQQREEGSSLGLG